MSRKPGAPAAGQAWAPFEAAVLPHVDRLFRLALWFERDRSEAEDLVQEAMRLAGAVFRDGPTLSRSDRATVRCDHVHWCHGYRCSGREPSGPRGTALARLLITPQSERSRAAAMASTVPTARPMSSASACGRS